MTAPRIPSTLRKEEKAAWRRIVADVGGRDVLDPSDEPILRSLAVLVARGENLRRALEDADLLIETQRGAWTGNPLLGHERETIKEIRLLHERLMKAIAGRGGQKKPASLASMRRDLRVVGSKR
jgi:phage terminase small subunit